MEIKLSIENKRGCGYRKPGGLYLVGRSRPVTCGMLPFPLTVCPCCGNGIKPARGFTWFNMSLFNIDQLCKGNCFVCPLPSKSVNNEKAGLIWVGSKYYDNAFSFIAESVMMGVSRRISQLPKDLQIGKTWVFFAHRQAVNDELPGIFHVFVPQRVEYVVTGIENQDYLERLVKRGITLVRVVRDIDAQQQVNFN